MDLNEIELDLLREDQINGSNRLEIFDKIGTRAAITDYAIALGGDVASNFFPNDTTFKSIHKNYTVDSRNYDKYSEKFDPTQLEEVELINGKKYTRVIIKPRFCEKTVTFSDGESYPVGKAVWIEKYPVQWYKDLKTDTVFNKDIIVSGIPFNHEGNYTGDFSKTDMYEYLNTYLKDADFESKQVTDISAIEYLQNMNLFLESEIERMQQQINENNQAIATYDKGYAKVRKK